MNYLLNSVEKKLESFAIHCPEDLMPGATLVYDGRNWRVGKVECCEGATDTSKAEVEKAKQAIDALQTLVNQLNEKIAALEANETSLEKWIDVSFNNEQEKTVSDSFITDKTIVDYNDDSGEHDADPITTVDNGSVTISFVKPVTGTVRLQLSKKKE